MITAAANSYWLMMVRQLYTKGKEIQTLCDTLGRTEMELARLKLERFYKATHQTVSQSTSTETVGHVERKASVVPLNKPVITTLSVWSTSSVRQPHD